MNQAFWSLIDRLIEESAVFIDRPKGSAHPRFPHMLYPLDYGYLADTHSMDGSGIDIWHGTMVSQRVEAIICTVDLMKRDSEIKLLMGCTEEEQKIVLSFHNDYEYMKGILISRNVR